MAGKLKITLRRSFAGRPETQRATARTLGLRKLNHSVEHDDTPAVRGMVEKISHLVTVEQV